MPYYAIMFWQRVDRTGGADACWPWLGEQQSRHEECGYTPEPLAGEQRVHRVAWALMHGPIPRGLRVRHTCPQGDALNCCNPAHMWLGGARAKSLFASIDASNLDGCWPWLGRMSRTRGTGRVTLRGSHYRVHELMYTQTRSAIPPGMEVAHTCGVHTCVNPAHLYLSPHSKHAQAALIHKH
jgi:HNH endonuclease